MAAFSTTRLQVLCARVRKSWSPAVPFSRTAIRGRTPSDSSNPRALLQTDQAKKSQLRRIMNAEENRFEQAGRRKAHWKRWGPYLSERQWGTVREDYSPYGTAWDFFPHDHARSRTYRWGEDGIMGICDRHQLVCFAVALWNGTDPILKERLF